MTDAPAIVHAKSFWKEPRNNLKSKKAPKRNIRVPPGAYIADLVGLGKAITLCRKCQPKFNVAGSGYTKYKEVTDVDYCYSTCQGCREGIVECNTFLKI